ncbi:MAG: response regulator [Oscillospiraceae bacterium]|nr:response regulator [Oscillospiraceae bacterium]
MPNRQKILIADDSEMNRAILAQMLENEFEIIEVQDGAEAVAVLKQYGAELSLLLLDIVMPNMDGFEVLAVMNKYKLIEDIPVIMISAETTPTYIERAYDLGVSDYISRPFDARIVHTRVMNTIMLYAKNKRLVGMVSDQIYEKEKSNNLMISILSHIVEFRNGESGMHVLHVQTITEILLNVLVHKTDKYHLKSSDISLISMASALHDIGKIGIPGKVLNKPGRFTDEEFAVMKTHSMLGATMLDELTEYKNEPLIKVAYEICRYHHERYDGRGYPDGLKGDEIPISAQIVSIADVYDALTSERVYKKAYSHEKAMEMILNGECGAFNPLLLECLKEAADTIRDELHVNSILDKSSGRNKLNGILEEMKQYDDLSASERTLRIMEHEREKYEFFASVTREMRFEYTGDPSMLMLSQQTAKMFGTSDAIMHPRKNEKVKSIFGEDNINGMIHAVSAATSEKPDFTYECEFNVGGEKKKYCLICRVVWSDTNPQKKTGVMGIITDCE